MNINATQPYYSVLHCAAQAVDDEHSIGQQAMVVDDGQDLHDAAKYLRGEIQPVPNDGLSSRHAKRSHFEQYRRTRQKALAVWLETVGMHRAFEASALDATVGDATEQGWRDDNDDRGVPCLFWFAGKWHCAIARWCNGAEKKQLKVLDPRGAHGQSNGRVLPGSFPKAGDNVRVHFLDAAEAPLFLQEGRYLAGVVVAPLAAHDSALVEVVGLAGPERFLVPNTRVELVAAEDCSRVVEVFKFERNQVLRQLDIATSQTIAIEVVSGVGKVADDITSVSLWALGDRLLIKVWQPKGEFMLETSVSAPEALAAVGMRGSGLTVLSESERKQLFERVTGHLRVYEGLLEMEIGYAFQEGQHSVSPEENRPRDTSSAGSAIFHREIHTLEGVPVETVVERADAGGLVVKTRTLPPKPERTDHIFVRPEDWVPLGIPSLRWLDANRKADLAVQLTRCLRASDGSLALQIQRVMRRPRGFIPCRSRLVSPENDRCPTSNPTPSALGTSRVCEAAHQYAEADTPCSSGAPAGLCSCRVVFRAATSLPSSGTGSILCGDDGSADTDEILHSRKNHRWLVVAKAIGGELTLSLFCPSREDKGGDGAGSDGRGTKTGGNLSGAGREEQRARQSRLLLATWEDWEGLGYGPLQWMSHAEKRFLGSLALSWISFRNDAGDSRDNDGHVKQDAFLQFRPTLARVTRVVDTFTAYKRSSSGSGETGLSVHTGVIGGPDAQRRRVIVRDSGRDFIVEVETEETGHAQCSGIRQTFGKEAWRETGLGELLWIDRSWRRYLASRLSKQVACRGSSLVIRSNVPVLYWSGTVTIARLGSHADGIFITVSDAGRRVLIEATDFEGGPVLASSTASLAEWTDATGIVALSPPKDEKAFRIRLEDQLAGLLGAGFRSRTKAMVNRRQGRKPVPGGGGRWRRTPYFSDYTTGVELQLDDDDDSGSEDGNVVTEAKGRSVLSPVSSRSAESSAAKKRALRLKMLTRMIDDYHSKHGRYGNRKGNAISAITPAVGAGSDRRERGSARLPPDSNTNNGNVSNNARDKAETEVDDGARTARTEAGTLPAIATSTQASSITDNSARRSLTTESSTHSSERFMAGGSIEEGASDTETLETHLCACCGGDGGKGHGRRCRHTFRRCGFCRVDEVRRVLFGAEHGRDRMAAPGHRGGAQRNAELLLMAVDGDSEDDYDWVTDTEEENPEYECDACGRLVDETKDRFHCNSCGDYDLCQACFLSHKAPAGQQHGEQAGSGHLASHDVSRIMAKPAVPGRTR